MDAEDDFTAMLAHLLRAAGLGTSVVPHDHPGLREALRHHRGPVLLGPGPGNPNDAPDPRMMPDRHPHSWRKEWRFPAPRPPTR